jgi:hypothetical protein
MWNDSLKVFPKHFIASFSFGHVHQVCHQLFVSVEASEVRKKKLGNLNNTGLLTEREVCNENYLP